MKTFIRTMADMRSVTRLQHDPRKYTKLTNATLARLPNLLGSACVDPAAFQPLVNHDHNSWALAAHGAAERRDATRRRSGLPSQRMHIRGQLRCYGPW